MSILKIPVVNKDGKPLTPCSPTKARKLLHGGVAEKKWNKLGIFYIRLIIETREYTPEVCLGLDPGAKFDGVAVVSERVVLQTGMLELPKGITKKMERRQNQRRNRRYRKCRRRPKRFYNRRRNPGWLAPSQKAKVDFRLKVIEELKKLYPINQAVIEDVKFDHYNKRWGKFFSTVEIGKTKLYEKLTDWFGEVKLVSGIKTAELRDAYGTKKCSDKRKRVLESHAIDALVIAANIIGLDSLVVFSFYIWRRYQYSRRQLHTFQYVKGGLRRREGGSRSMNGFQKGDVVIFKNRLGRVGGYMESRGMSLHSFDVNNRRFTQNAKPDECIRLFAQKILYSAIPPLPKGLGFCCGRR